MDYPIITIQREISNLMLEPGQTLTVWAGEHAQRQQIELRVRHDGIIEVFSDASVRWKLFEDWYRLDDESALEKNRPHGTGRPK